jgi:predicted Zn-dependent peptidase
MQQQSDYQKVILENGIRIVTEKISHVRSVTIGFIITTGSRDESADLNGLSHFIEHMIFKGTARRSAKQIAIEIDAIGGFFDAFTSREFIGISIKVLDENVSKAVGILADIVLNPTFDETDLERERSVIVEEIKMVEDTPDDLIHDLLAGHIWKGHPLGRPVIGSMENVLRFKRDDLLRFWRQHFIAANVIIAAAGNIEHAKITALFRKHFGKMNSARSGRPMTPPVFQSGLLSRQKQLEQVHVCLGWDGLPQDHPRRFASYIYNTLLGSSMSSRLFQVIREKHGLTYSIYSYRSSYLDGVYFVVYAGCSPANVDKVISLSLKTIKDLAKVKISGRELDRVKAQLKGNLVLGLESTYNRMNALAKQEIYFGRFISLDETLHDIDQVDAEEVLDFSRSVVDQGKPALVTIGPGVNEDAPKN